MQHNKQYYVGVLFKSFHLNGPKIGCPVLAYLLKTVINARNVP